VDKNTKKDVIVPYIALYIAIIFTVSFIQISQNTFTAYALTIEYNSHTTIVKGGLFTPGFFDFDSTIIVHTPVMVDGYESTLGNMQVFSYPVWVNTSSWATGESVSISGNIYSISEETVYWTAHRSIGDEGDYVNLYYEKVLGIFVKSNSDFMSLGSSGYRGSSTSIRIQRSNIDGFVSRVYGTNVVVQFLLLSGIFIEIPIIVWLRNRRDKQKSARKFRQTSTPSS
jgi:hypothetical protein